MVSNRRLITTEGPDFYPTPNWGTLGLLKYEIFEGIILEPCCGDGAMSEVLIRHGYDVKSSDLYDRGYGGVQDFFGIHDKYDNIVTNPPFNIAEDVLEHALKIANRKICLLLRTAFLESVRRYNKFFSVTPPSRVLVFTKRLSMYPAGYPVKGGGTTSYSWFVWDKETDGRTEISWIV